MAVSRARRLDFPNFKNLSFPGAKSHNISHFIPPHVKANWLPYLLAGTILRLFYALKHHARRSCLKDLDSSRLSTVCNRVFFLASPQGFSPKGIGQSLPDDKLDCDALVKNFLNGRSRKACWAYQGVSEYIYCESNLSGEDHIHLNLKVLSGIHLVLKNRVSSKKYCQRIAAVDVLQLSSLEVTVFYLWLLSSWQPKASAQDPRCVCSWTTGTVLLFFCFHNAFIIYT